MTRLLVLLLSAYIIYYLIRTSLKGKTTGNARQTSVKKQKPENAETANTRLKEIAYVYYSTAKDNDACTECNAFEGRYFLPNHKMLHSIRPPYSGCKSHKGCRCTLVYVTRDEEDSGEIESILKKHGGMCDRQTIRKGLAG
jgi:hypothetical protein